MVEDELVFDTHFQFVTTFLKLPAKQATVGRQAQIDAVMADQILRRLWR